MSKTTCTHTNARHAVCGHVCDPAFEFGVKRFTGIGHACEYLCSDCAAKSDATRHFVCDACLAPIESKADWHYQGKAEIIHKPQAFTFTPHSFHLACLDNADLLTSAPLLNSTGDWLLFSSNGELIRLDGRSKKTQIMAVLTNEQVCRTGEIQLCVSENNLFAALTSNVRTTDEGPSSNLGWVVDLTTGEALLILECGDYHTENAPFPVCFVEHDNKTLLIHATEWDRLDITDLTTLKHITERSYVDKPDNWQENKNAFSEWNGQLLVSPDKQWIATIGWAWHPVGLALAWNLQTWLNENIWEADYGLSKRSFSNWSYFWFSPFCWVNDTTLCVWGYEGFIDEDEIPYNSVALYNVSSGELIRWFTGPSMDSFYYDDYLFSGSTQPTVKPGALEDKALRVWDIQDGTLLHQQENLTPDNYHPESKCFLGSDKPGELTLTHWSKSN